MPSVPPPLLPPPSPPSPLQPLPQPLSVTLVPPKAKRSPSPPPRPKDDRFYPTWEKFTSRKRPKNIPSYVLDADPRAGHHPEGENAVRSFEEARSLCKAKVAAIVDECQRLNKKYVDPAFDLNDEDDCLIALDQESPFKRAFRPGSFKRIDNIYETPQFYVDGATANDIRQGKHGDCWYLAALAALSAKETLLTRLCVAQHPDEGVYGFLFYRDGEWISEVIDDRLYLIRGDDELIHLAISKGRSPDKPGLARFDLDEPLSKEHREALQRGSKALYFASCVDSNETWLPLIEKAYAKAHGDYQSIAGGNMGEAIEDLTGGVAVNLIPSDILDKEKFWSEELTAVNEKFLFGCSSFHGEEVIDQCGVVQGHAYTVVDAREVQGHRLVKIRNPWSETEWNGAWSDGSKEWTWEMMKALDHKFGDDGVFWMSYKDFLQKFANLQRTRLFGPEWTVAQQWTTLDVPPDCDFLETKFSLHLAEPCRTVIVLSQLDDRYFQGLEGRFTFDLHFRLYKDGEGKYLGRSMGNSGTGRSCSLELYLAAGDYSIFVKIQADRDAAKKTADEVIREYKVERKDKLLAVGHSFDLAHSKGRLKECDTAKKRALASKAKSKVLSKCKVDRSIKQKVREKEKRSQKRKRDLIAEKRARRRAEVAAERKAKDTADKEPTTAEAEMPVAEPNGESAMAAENEGDTATGYEPTTTAEVELMTAVRDYSAASIAMGKLSGDSDDEASTVSVDKPTTGAQDKPRDDAENTPEDVAREELTATGNPEPPTDVAKGEPVAITDGGMSTTVEEAILSEKLAGITLQDGTNDSTSEQQVAAADEGVSGSIPQTDCGSMAKAEVDQDTTKRATASTNHEPRSMRAETAVDDPGTAAERLELRSDRDFTDDRFIMIRDDITVSSVITDDFDWQSDIDGPVWGDEERDGPSADEQDLFGDDPWNALCVVGLRVYSENADVKIEVVTSSEDG